MKFNILHLTLVLLLSSNLSAQFKNVPVSRLSSFDPEEVTIAINHSNTKEIAAGANIDYFYFSKDGGLSWQEKSLSSSLGVWGDPCVIFNNKNELFFAHLSNPISGHWIDRIVVQKSVDKGKSWNNGIGIGYRMVPVVQDKEWMAVDRTNSPYRDNLYIAWTEFDEYGSISQEDSTRIRFALSDDDGNSWSEPIVISDVGGNCVDDDLTVEGAVPSVGPNGEVYISWSGPLGIVFDKSLDGGRTFGKDIFVADQPGGWAFNIPGISRCNGMPITACDVSQSNFRGNIYINWSDQRNGLSNTDIFFIKSEDGGDSWSDIIKVNSDQSERHQFFTWMSVDQITGIIYIVFYDRRNTSKNETEVYLARSDDGGETFTNHKISNSSFDPVSSIFFGDYTNIDSHNGIIRPIWMRMDYERLSVWTAIIEDSQLTDVEEEEKIIVEYELLQNYPNPFNPETTISYILPESDQVEIRIYDALGNLVKTLFKGAKPSGVHELTFNAGGLSSGMYLYRIETSNFIANKKMIFLK